MAYQPLITAEVARWKGVEVEAGNGAAPSSRWFTL
ncbi:MAG: hypothetical protein CM15mP116_01540 [Synechococcus sp.]|nr:MAG: hypothetical protein CM15mP116_01540 [Synechococcus sp.]